MKTLFFCIIAAGAIFAWEKQRGAPVWCVESADHFMRCAEIEGRSIYYNTGNPWPAITPILAMDDLLSGRSK